MAKKTSDSCSSYLSATHLLSVSVLTAASLGACIGQEPATTPDNKPSPDPLAGEEGEEAPETKEPSTHQSEATTHFDALSHPERMQYMKKVVTPKMKELFVAHDAKEFRKFNCSTCHGSPASYGNFEMPNPELVALDPTDHFASAKEHHGATVAFMMEKVVPEMARLLGEKAYNPATGEGFGCFECHTMKK
ncbi:MAG: hypothetical protein MK135_02545 [Polyangiaceae bacterium]|nr:hypothetical protein [Polyangiaceae bacterium]